MSSRSVRLSDLLTSKLTRDATAVLVARGVGAVASFGLAIALGRRLGTAGTGLYYLAFAVATAASVLGRFGLDGAMMRFVATAAGRGDWDDVRAVYRHGVLVSGSLSLVLAGGLLAGAGTLATNVFDKPDLADALTVGASLIPALVLIQVHAQVIKALGRPIVATALQTIGPPVSALLGLTLGGVGSAVGAVAVVSVSYWAFVVLAAAVWWRSSRYPGIPASGTGLRALLRVSLPLLVTTSMHLVIGQTDTLMLGVLGNADDVGAYASALRLAAVVSLILVALESVVPPQYATHHDRGERFELEHLARSTSILGAGAAIVPVVLMLVLASPLMGLFGSGFVIASSSLRILVLGQLVNVGVGSVGFLLVMTGEERLLQRTMVGAAVANIVLNIVLIPPFGLVGAATATSLSIAGLNIVNVLWVRRHLGINPVAIGHSKASRTS